MFQASDLNTGNMNPLTCSVDNGTVFVLERRVEQGRLVLTVSAYRGGVPLKPFCPAQVYTVSPAATAAQITATANHMMQRMLPHTREARSMIALAMT